MHISGVQHKLSWCDTESTHEDEQHVDETVQLFKNYKSEPQIRETAIKAMKLKIFLGFLM